MNAKARYLNQASNRIHQIVGTMCAAPGACSSIAVKSMTESELAKIAELRVALARYENELRAYAG